MDQYYGVFGFLFIVYCLEIITCCNVASLFAYYQLCEEGSFNWWWQFVSTGSMSLLVLLYSSLWYGTLEATGVYAPVVYFGSMMWLSLAVFLTMGFLGVQSTIWFIRKIKAIADKSEESEGNNPLVGVPSLNDDTEGPSQIELT